MKRAVAVLFLSISSLMLNGQTGGAVISGTLTVSGAATVGSNLTVAGPSPWIDVTSSTYGCKADGVTDDTACMNSALTACSGTGGTVFIPPGKTVLANSQILQDGISKCTLLGGGGAAWTALSAGASRLLLGTATSPAFRASNAVGFTIRGLLMQMHEPIHDGRLPQFRPDRRGADRAVTHREQHHC
jgi:hypothetical protein